MILNHITECSATAYGEYRGTRHTSIPYFLAISIDEPLCPALRKAIILTVLQFSCIFSIIFEFRASLLTIQIPS